FQQVGDTLTGKPKGTGLGLTICRDIVAHHGGRLTLTSQPGLGSTFSIWLPVPEAERLAA
ncbi:MAG TPA: ATP-binding protein, partial [Chloroflexota bacterium]|nr:ATP-binding protein [Chloroflexota bacterium]